MSDQFRNFFFTRIYIPISPVAISILSATFSFDRQSRGTIILAKEEAGFLKRERKKKVARDPLKKSRIRDDGLY